MLWNQRSYHGPSTAYSVCKCTDKIDPVQYIGCFSDKTEDGRPALFEEGITTVKECVTTRSGQAFVALEYGGQCWNNWGTRHMDGREKLPDSSCANAGTTNPDSSGNIMGGSYSAAVYSTVPVLTKLSNIANANKNHFNKLYVESCNHESCSLALFNNTECGVETVCFKIVTGSGGLNDGKNNKKQNTTSI